MPLFMPLLLAGALLCGDAELIRQARYSQNEAIKTGCIDLISSYWTDDVSIRTGLGQAIIGKESYAAAFAGTKTIYIRTPDCIEVSAKWPLAYESGSWVGIVGEIQVSGRYAAQWVKKDSWLIRSEVFVALDAEGDCSFQAVP